MGQLIQFKPKEREYEYYELWPADWESEFNPTMLELRLTFDTIEYYRNDLIHELATAGVSAEFGIREGLEQLDCMHKVLWNYYRTD